MQVQKLTITVSYVTLWLNLAERVEQDKTEIFPIRSTLSAILSKSTCIFVAVNRNKNTACWYQLLTVKCLRMSKNSNSRKGDNSVQT